MIAKQKIKDANKKYITDVVDGMTFNLAIESQSFTLDDINFNIDYKVTTYSINDNIEDSTKNFFDMEKIYLLSFSILRKDYEQNIMIKLIDPSWQIKDSLKNEQNINYVALKIPVQTDDNNLQSETFSFVFKPNSKNFNKIIFQSLGDYEVVKNNNDTENIEIENRIVDLSDIKIEEVNVNAIFDDDKKELSKIKEFGIQGPPGLLFTINGEGFHIGRTGMFYLAEDDFIFESIGVCDNTLPFVIDYKIEE